MARTPVVMFRHGWGWLFGGRLLMLEHRGRRSGQPRYVVLEVVGQEPGSLFVVSGYGARSQWFRNVRERAAVRVWTARNRAVPGVAAPLPDDETRTRLERYRAHHRLAAAALGRLLDIPELRHADPLPDDVARRLPVVRVEVPVG